MIVVYLACAFLVLPSLIRAAYVVREYALAGESERRALARPLVVVLLDSTSITLVGIIVLLAAVGTVPSSGLIFTLPALFLTNRVLRWRWRKSFPPPGPEAVRIRRRIFALTRGLGIVFLLVQGVFLLRDRGLADETPIWPGMVGLSFLITALIYYLQGRRDRKQNAGNRRA